MTRFMMAVLMIGSCALPVRAEYGATVGARYVNLDTRGSRGQVQEYDGKLYYVAHGDVQVSNESANGLFDFALMDIGSTEENASLNVDHKSGFKAGGKYSTLHHRMNFRRVGEVIDGTWLPKTAIDLRGLAEGQELVLRRSESEVNFAFVSPTNSARFISAQYWGVDKVGSRPWSYSGTNIQVSMVDVNSSKRDFTLGLGTNIREAGALSVDLLRSEFEDNAYVNDRVINPGGGGSANNGGVAKRADPKQSMTGAEFKFRHDVTKGLAVTGAFTGRQRANLRTQYKFSAVVGALNAAYHAGEKLSLLGKLYLRAFQIDENNGYFPALQSVGARVNTQGNQLDKTTVRGEFLANYRPVEKVHLKAAYKLELNNRRDAQSQVYSDNRYFTDGYFVPAPWVNATAHSDTRHLFTLGAKAELPLGVEVEADFKKLQANRAAFVSLANKRDDANAMVTVPLPLNVTATLAAGFLKEKNTVPNFNHYSLTQNTYRAGLDWAAASNKAFFGADISEETVKNYSELYLGSGAATNIAGTYHKSVCTTQKNTVWGLHGKVNLPKGVVVMGNGSYTRSVATTPIDYRFTGAGAASPYSTVNDFTPNRVGIARGSLAMEFTPEKFKNLTARASYSVSDWVDRFDSLNSGRASVAQLGASMKF